MKMEKVKPLNTKFCRYLRAKSPYGGLEGGENQWYLLDNANTICWCIQSAGGSAPDNGFVDPPHCVEGRSCYVAPKD